MKTKYIMDLIINTILICFVCQLMFLADDLRNLLLILKNHSLQITVKQEPQKEIYYKLPKLEEY